MIPIHVVVYHESDEILPVGAFMTYQEAVDAMVEDMVEELTYVVTNHRRAKKIIAQARKADPEVLSDFKDCPPLSVCIDTDAGQGMFSMYDARQDWRILNTYLTEGQATKEQEEQK